MDNATLHPDRPGEIGGVARVPNDPAELVDPHRLFANHPAAAAARHEQLVCLIPDWDPWMQNMLRPLVEAAGYRVVDDSDDEQADVVIATVGEDLPGQAINKTIWLRPELEPKGKKDESIYRYDRAGLLMALKSVGAGRGK